MAWEQIAGILQIRSAFQGGFGQVTELAGDETEGQFSPDGNWVAFVSSLSGRPEVYVQSFPAGASRTQLSTAGGTQVRWSDDGREIYFVAPDGKLPDTFVTICARDEPVQGRVLCRRTLGPIHTEIP